MSIICYVSLTDEKKNSLDGISRSVTCVLSTMRAIDRVMKFRDGWEYLELTCKGIRQTQSKSPRRVLTI